ncbi:hypothetical protein GCM10023079_45490 [Streptomyces chitinivorans]
MDAFRQNVAALLAAGDPCFGIDSQRILLLDEHAPVGIEHFVFPSQQLVPEFRTSGIRPPDGAVSLRRAVHTPTPDRHRRPVPRTALAAKGMGPKDRLDPAPRPIELSSKDHIA